MGFYNSKTLVLVSTSISLVFLFFVLSAVLAVDISKTAGKLLAQLRLMQSFEVERFLLDVDKAFIKIIWIKCATLQPSYHSNTARGEAHSPLPSHDLPFFTFRA